VFEHTILVAIQETIIGFINDHVIPEDGEFHHNPRLGLKSMSFEWRAKICVTINRRLNT
jgi:hypothetical protein